MMRIRKILSLFCCIFLTIMMMFFPQMAQAEFPERPVGFVVIDNDGSVDGNAYKSWRQVVKWAYHFPHYKLVDDGLSQQLVSKNVREGIKLDKISMSALAEKSKVDVLVVARIKEMDEIIVSGWVSHFEPESYVRVVADAELFVYKKDGEKFLKKKVREHELHEMANYEKPVEIIKWELSKLVNTIENRPIIGS